MDFDLTVSKKAFEGLTDYKRLDIPIFQRPYEWGTMQWSDLWSDVSINMGQPYLMGGIVICGDGGDGHMVIDGQQRITTITLLIAVCRDYLYRECADRKSIDAAREFHADYIVSGGVLDKKRQPYLRLGEVDREWFNRHIQVSPESKKEYSPPDIKKVNYGLPSSNRLLWKGYKYFYDQLLSRHSKAAFSSIEAKYEDVLEFVRQIAQNTWFVCTRVGNDTQAFTLFEVLNDRGLELSISDLIKNVVLSQASKVDRLERAKSLWGEIVDALDHENVAAFLRYFWMSCEGKRVSENQLFPKLKDDIRKMNAGELTGYLRQLSDEAENFAEILGRSKVDEDLAREIFYLTSYGFRVGHTVLLATWASSPDSKTRQQVVRSIKEFLVKYAIFANQVTNELEGLMAEMAAMIRKDLKSGLEELKKRLTEKQPTVTAIAHGFTTLEPTIPVARALLIEIECELVGTEKFPAGPNKVNVEHIFPQSPTDEWRASFGGDAVTQDSFTHRLGNLTLLDAKLNKRASNKPYIEKRTDYYKKSDFTITNKLPKEGPWTETSVDGRQAELLRTAKLIWKFK